MFVIVVGCCSASYHRLISTLAQINNAPDIGIVNTLGFGLLIMVLIYLLLEIVVFSRLDALKRDLNHVVQEEKGRLYNYTDDSAVSDIAQSINELITKYDVCKHENIVKSQTYERLVQDSPAMIVRFYPNGCPKFCNNATLQFIEATHCAPDVSFISTYVPEDSQKKARTRYQTLTPEKPVSKVFTLPVKIKGNIKWVDAVIAGIFDANGCTVEYQVVCFDVTNRVKLNAQLQAKLDLEDKLVELSTKLVRSTDDTFNDNIINILSTIGTWFGTDRGYLYLNNVDHTLFENITEWHQVWASAPQELFKHIKVNDYEWFSTKLNKREIIKINNIDALPAVATNEQAMLKQFNIGSMLIIPIKNGELLGFIGFDCSAPKVWSESDLNLLSIFSDLIGAVIKQKSR